MSAALKAAAAKAAIAYVEDNMVVGVGTGSTVDFFIKELALIKHRLDGCVASSEYTKNQLRELGIPVLDLNVVGNLQLYVDGADEVNARRELIKGGGGALTREKIIATVAQQFVCIVDETKPVTSLGDFPVAVEVLPLARSFVGRQLVKLGANPAYREGFVTDNGNIILDVYQLDLTMPSRMEEAIKLIPGVVESGIFAKRCADVVLVAGQNGVSSF